MGRMGGQLVAHFLLPSRDRAEARLWEGFGAGA